jgi:hypothetical protein
MSHGNRIRRAGAEGQATFRDLMDGADAAPCATVGAKQRRVKAIGGAMWEIKLLAAYPHTTDYDCSEETFTPDGSSTMAHPGNLPRRLGELLADSWEPIGAGYVYGQVGNARTQVALRRSAS